MLLFMSSPLSVFQCGSMIQMKKNRIKSDPLLKAYFVQGPVVGTFNILFLILPTFFTRPWSEPGLFNPHEFGSKAQLHSILRMGTWQYLPSLRLGFYIKSRDNIN